MGELVEDSLAEAELRLITAHSPTCIHRIGLDGRLASMNRAGLKMLGVEEADVLGKRYVDAVSNADRPRIAQHLADALLGQESHFTFRSTGGRAFSSCFLPVRDAAGSIRHLTGITEDLTHHEQLTAEASAAEGRVANVSRSIGGIIWEASAETFEFSFVSEGAERILGYPASSWLGDRSFWPDHIHADDRAAAVDYCVESTRAGKDHDLEYRMIAADGREIWLHDLVTVVSEQGRPTRLRGVMVDVTRRKTAEAALRLEEALVRTVVDELPYGVLVVDNRTDAILLFNRRFCEIWGIEALEPAMRRGELANKDIIAPCMPRVVDVAAFAASCEPLQDPECRAVVADEIAFHGDRTVRRFSTQVRDHADQYVGRLYFFEDITERRRMQMRLTEAERLGALGTLSAGIAHEVNNPLSYVIANLWYVRSALQKQGAGEVPSDDLDEVLAEAEEGAERVAAIVRDLKVFSRRSDEVLETSDPRAALEFALRLTANERQFRARLHTDIGRLPLVHGASSRLSQVFVNLLANAAQSLPDGESTKHVVSVRARVDGTSVLVEISDTGRGMTPEQRRRAFEPFFTTREVGGGTGLGLAICHGIMTQLGGELTIDSTPGRGTCVSVRLRTAEPPVEGREPGSHVDGAPATERRRILIIDDEPTLLRALSRLVVGLRHDVLTVGSAEGALELLASGDRFDVILCDLMLKGMSGVSFAAELERSWPSVLERTIFITGGALDRAAADFARSHRTLDKPIDHTALGLAIEATARSTDPPHSRG